MKEDLTLKELVNEQIDKYKLPNDAKTEEKLRQKFRRTLKHDPYFIGIHAWENAKPDPNSNSKAKVISKDVISKLLNKCHDYLDNLAIKESGLTTDEFNKIKDEHAANYANVVSGNREAYDRKQADLRFINEQVENYSRDIMLKAIFEHFFTPLNKDKLRKDVSRDYYFNTYGDTEPYEFSTDNSRISLHERLNHPEKFYYHELSKEEKKSTKKSN